ncbi:thiol methyltransferase 1 [Microstroma glucosiphilum]|uniref:Thiol methyltransferase 1 n=1 Tax=Pseudomicrostroma glucosiphilum TaxID=1684307 RepID=A0A316UE83_9BASI|nr:thiol methyltransferase 1 [Pseudomicrostroma glucosiphilum]PWN23218.1 thiol methyltransferase 1 [Pseudomicrostroma glucosiphilum]
MGDGLDQSRWSAAWTAKQTPWDSGGIPQPSLVSFMEDVEEGKALRQDSQRKRVLIPGCGTGYDVEYFARLGFKEARGADIAPEATQAAQAWVDSLSPRPERYDRIHLESMDYLALADARIEAESQYDLIYDYTFFCALPPSLRAKWAKAHANNLKAGEGMLITLCFPMQGDRPGGPPYSVSPELYREHLLPHFDLQYQGVPPGQPESRKGIEAVMLWKRKV